MLGGVWQGFSAYKSFEIAIKPGLWNGLGLQFYVPLTRAYINNFSIRIYVTGCGYYTITHTKPVVPISNKRFSFYGTFSAFGTFTDPTHISGKLGLSYYYISGCGYVSGGPFSWTATWKNSTQPTALTMAEVTPFVVEAGGGPDYYSVEHVDPIKNLP